VDTPPPQQAVEQSSSGLNDNLTSIAAPAQSKLNEHGCAAYNIEVDNVKSAASGMAKPLPAVAEPASKLMNSITMASPDFPEELAEDKLFTQQSEPALPSNGQADVSVSTDSLVAPASDASASSVDLGSSAGPGQAAHEGKQAVAHGGRQTMGSLPEDAVAEATGEEHPTYKSQAAKRRTTTEVVHLSPAHGLPLPRQDSDSFRSAGEPVTGPPKLHLQVLTGPAAGCTYSSEETNMVGSRGSAAAVQLTATHPVEAPSGHGTQHPCTLQPTTASQVHLVAAGEDRAHGPV
jgi:hypothetical protein